MKAYFMYSHIIFLSYIVWRLFFSYSMCDYRSFTDSQEVLPQGVYGKMNALLLETFSKGARQCKNCLRRFRYQRTEKHTLKIHKNTSSFGLLPSIQEENGFRSELFPNTNFHICKLYSAMVILKFSQYPPKHWDHYIYHELTDIHRKILVSVPTNAFFELKYVRLYW